MHLEHKIILLIITVVAAFVIGFGIGRQFEQMEPQELLEMAGIKKICSFEGEQDLLFFEKTDIPAALSTKHVTDGMYSLEVIFPGEEGALSAWRTFVRDWSPYQFFSFDVFNDQYTRLRLEVAINDEAGTDTYREVFYLNDGSSNHVEINLTSVGRRIDLTRIRQILFSLRDASGKNTLFFDNLRLEKKTRTT